METVTVNATALRNVLQALMGPSHHVMELWATQSLPDSDISKLVQQFNAAVKSAEPTGGAA
jgi:hypothetical protein